MRHAVEGDLGLPDSRRSDWRGGREQAIDAAEQRVELGEQQLAETLRIHVVGGGNQRALVEQR